jgi:hypothetical protein
VAKEQYIKGHDAVCAQIHMQGKWVKLDIERWCDHVPKSVETICEGDKIT